MTSGIQSKGVDLDSIFDPYVTGASPGLTGIQYAGTDIHTRYAPLVYGTQAAATGLLCKVGGAGSFVDLNTLFAAKGTAKYPLLGASYSAENAGRNNIALTFPTASTWSIATNGTWNGSQPALSGSLNTYGTVNQFFLHIVNAGVSGSLLTTAPTDVWTSITAGLMVVTYDTNTLTGNQESAEFTLALRFNSGATLSFSDTTFTIWNTNPH